MTRIFSLLFRMGKFPRPPRAVLRVGRDGSVAVGEPRVVYQSKIALVLLSLIPICGARSHYARSAWIETVGSASSVPRGPVALRKECVD